MRHDDAYVLCGVLNRHEEGGDRVAGTRTRPTQSSTSRTKRPNAANPNRNDGTYEFVGQSITQIVSLHCYGN